MKETKKRIKKKFDLHKEVDSSVQKISSDEDFLFYQYSMFWISEKFDDNTNALFREEKTAAFQTAMTLLNYNYDVSTIIKSINSFSFLKFKICFNEPQFNIFNFLQKQIFIGEYIIGFAIDNFESKIYDKKKYESNLNNFKRALKVFKKNNGFKVYDEKIIRLLSYFSSVNSTNKFYNNLRNYFKIANELKEFENEKNKKAKY